MSITTGVLPTYAGITTDSRIDDIKNLMLSEFDFLELVSDTGSSASRSVKFKIADDGHILEISRSGTSAVKFGYKNISDSSVLDSSAPSNIGFSTPYAVIRFGNTVLFAFNSSVVFFITNASSNIVICFSTSSSGLRRYAKNSDTPLVVSNVYFPMLGNGNQPILPVYAINDDNTEYLDSPLENIFTFANGNALSECMLVQAGAEKYMVTYVYGSTNLRGLVRYQ